MKTSANPRKPIYPASVTASELIPTLATKKPFIAPNMSPTASAATMASAMFHPDSCNRAITAADSPIIDATDKSISPLMMTKVMISATIAFSMLSCKRFA